MRILVTGACGFTGIPLITALLDAGHHVTALDNFMFGETPLFHLGCGPQLVIHRADIRHLVAFARSEILDHQVIFHLAGISGHPACEADPTSAYSVNVRGTVNLIDAMSDDQILINASTTSFYGPGHKLSAETDEIVPVNLYGSTKKEAEDLCMQRENSISLRWPTVFGVAPRMRHDLMVNDFVRRAMRDGVLVLYDPDAMRTFIHIEDQTAGYLFALANIDKMRGGIFNMGSPSLNYTKRQIVRAVSAVVPCEIITRPTPDKDVRDFIVEFGKCKALGFECTRTLDQGVRELAKLYRFHREAA